MAETLARIGGRTPRPTARNEGQPAEPRLAQSTPTFERLVAEHQGRVARLCYRLLGWREDVEDVVQEVFLAAFGGLPEFRGESNVSTWLTRIAVNTCRTHLRRRRLWLRFIAGAREEHESSGARSADHELMSRERFERVRRAVRKLPVKYREVTVLRYLEEMSVADIAEVLELSRNAVEVRLNRARKHLKGDLAGVLEG